MKKRQGYFIGKVIAEWLHEPGADRKMRIIQDFSFVDANGKTWLAPANSIVDGASIPELLWSIVGGPFEGDYRDASVVHDVYCDIKTRPSKEVHQCFAEMLKVLGLPFWKRKLMSLCVKTFGPKF